MLQIFLSLMLLSIATPACAMDSIKSTVDEFNENNFTGLLKFLSEHPDYIVQKEFLKRYTDLEDKYYELQHPEQKENTDHEADSEDTIVV